MPAQTITPRYMTRFSCIGGACEDTCCSGWGITLDAADHRKLRRVLGQTKADRELFDKNVKRLRGGARSDTKFALIVLQPTTGYCGFLGADKLCSLHGRFGESSITDVCSTYPRRQSVVGDRVELAAALSCPEAARQALLADDGMELVDLDRRDARDVWVQIADPEGDLYAQSLDVVRMSMMQILAGAGSLAAGLGTLAALADALGTGFGKGKVFDPQAVVRTLEDFEDPARAKEIASALASIDVPLEVPMRPLLEILAKRFELPEGRFGDVLKHAANAYSITDNALVADVAKAYGARRKEVGALIDGRLNRILVNYALNHTFTDWFTGSQNLGVWVRGLILRVALVRFLVHAHPDVAALATAATDGDATRTVERVAIDTVYRMGRTIDHHGPFVTLLDRVLPESMPGLEHALCLLKL